MDVIAMQDIRRAQSACLPKQHTLLPGCALPQTQPSLPAVFRSSQTVTTALRSDADDEHTSSASSISSGDGGSDTSQGASLLRVRQISS